MRWLERQESGQVRDAAYATMAWDLAGNANYDAAMETTANIEDASIRSQMVRIVNESRQLYQDTEGRRRVGSPSSLPDLKF